MWDTMEMKALQIHKHMKPALWIYFQRTAVNFEGNLCTLL